MTGLWIRVSSQSGYLCERIRAAIVISSGAAKGDLLITLNESTRSNNQ